MKDFLFHESLADLDPELVCLISYETERQARKLIMVPSESIAPFPVHEALASAFSHIYAEGYPKEYTRKMTESQILDYETALGNYRRYADRRYYKGVEYANVLEALARRRVADAFATEAAPADQLHVNVQALSGAPANTAVQYALLNPGDTILSMALHVGGHLSHGSKVAWSGHTYQVVNYDVDSHHERLDYDAIREQALAARPKLIIAGYTSYPWAPDWEKFRAIADEVGAYLLADIAHVAGLVIGGVYPNPVGIADAVTFTTHKTLNGPRGAVIITHKAKLGRKFDRAVFPGFQGGPHMETVAGLAATMQFARTEKFRQLQQQTVRNAVALAEALQAEGIRVPYGGTDTHLLLFDCKTIVGPDGAPLMGDPAVRILDIAGLVANRNTIPGDLTAAYPSGVRLGTPWITQRGLGEPEMARIAELIARLMRGMQPYKFVRHGRDEYRARVDFDTLEAVKLDFVALAEQAATPECFLSCQRAPDSGYPHFYYINDVLRGNGVYERLELVGALAANFVDWLTPSYVMDMADGDTRPITLLEPDGRVMATGVLTRVSTPIYWLDVPADIAPRVLTWMRALVDGYVATDDVYGRLPFINAVRDLGEVPAPPSEIVPESGPFTKPYFIGAWSCKEPAGDALPPFVWQEPEEGAAANASELRKTRLHAVHRAMGARMVPFGGWDMPVWYTGNLEEHRAVREAAGLFDVSHMGCWDVQGPEAALFLNMLLVNDINYLDVGRSQYTAFFGVDGVPLDDLIVYRMADAHYLLVVNAANNDKDWAWVNAVLKGEVCIDPNRPWVRWQGGGVTVRDLRDAAAGEDMRAELALQGPKSRAILLALGGTAEDLARVKRLPWTGIARVTLGDFDVIVSRTGYTGERTAYELFVHPDRLAAFWQTLLEVGESLGVKPCGLAARDSLRLEAGLPLYGHEMAGPLNLTMAEAGFGGYIKIYKSFFVGREAFIARDLRREGGVMRFGVPEKGPMPQQGDPVVDDKGKVVGFVTSCAIDTEGQQIGQAYVRDAYTAEGTQLAVLVSPRREPKPRAQLTLGDRTQLPVGIVVLSRFPKR
jgi:glycine hydroxymethyltransferase